MDAPAAVRGAYPGAALTAWGAGLIQIALGAGTLTGTQASAVLTPAAGTVLIGLGAAGFAWGGTALARGRLVVPRAGAAGVLSGVVVLAIALSMDPAGVSVVAVAAASILLIATGVGCALTWRSTSAAPIVALGRRLRREQARAARPRVVGILVAGVLVAAVVTPALAATEAGQLAPEHGSHFAVTQDHH